MILLRLFSSKDRKKAAALKNILGFYPGNLGVYELAFRHRSASVDTINGSKNSNERLEYLGDAILGAVVAEFLFKKFPFKDEGFLTEIRSRIVSRVNLNKLSLKLGLDKFIINSPENTRSKSIFGDAFEALIGAVYIDKGFLTAQKFILHRIIRNHVDIEELVATETNFKSRLIEWVQKERKNIRFELIDDTENSNRNLIKVQVIIDGVSAGTGLDFSKKRAEQLASEEACRNLGI